MKTVFLAAALLFSAAVLADDAPGIAKVEPSRFSDVKAAIEKDLAAGERYVEISEENRKRVVEALHRMEVTLDGVGSVQELSAEERAKLLTDQNLVNTLLTNAAEDSHLICRREQKVGTRFKTTVCQTVAERRRERDENQDTLRNRQHSVLRGPTDG